MKTKILKKTITLLALVVISLSVVANTDWTKQLKGDDKIQADLIWKAKGGQADFRFIYEKLAAFKIQVTPQAQFPNKHWSQNSLIFPITDNSELNLTIPFGVITQVKSGQLTIQANLSLSFNGNHININQLKMTPVATFNKGDLVNFILKDEFGNNIFKASSIHIELDMDKKLLNMSNIDLMATDYLAEKLNTPFLTNQVIAQLHTYNHLKIPNNAITSPKNIEIIQCVNNPIWPPDGIVDVELTNIGTIQYLFNIDSERLIIVPSASLKNVGSADVAWYLNFSGNFPPYNNDQHPYLNWSIYREVDNRFEQIAISGLKHAFYTVNLNCPCPGGQVLGLGCEDVYGTGNNDSPAALGPRDELNALTGVWENCGSYFDPMPCTGSQQNTSNNRPAGQNRLIVYEADLTNPQTTSMFFQAWYLVRDDVNIFNSMGYKSINPVPVGGGGWNIFPGSTFSNGASIENYVPINTTSDMMASTKVESNEGTFTVAVKVIDLGNGLYRYNYAVENYDFSANFKSFIIPLADASQLTDIVFNDPEHDDSNNWITNHSKDNLEFIGNNNNELSWGKLFSFSFTTDLIPVQKNVKLEVANPQAQQSYDVLTLIPDLTFKSGFE